MSVQFNYIQFIGNTRMFVINSKIKLIKIDFINTSVTDRKLTKLQNFVISL